MMDIYKDRIKPLFDASGLNDQTLEKEIGLPSHAIYKWEVSGVKSYVTHIGKIAKYFGVSADYLLGLTDGTKKSLPGPRNEAEEALMEKLGKISPDDLPRVLSVLDGLSTNPEKTRSVLDLLPKVL